MKVLDLFSGIGGFSIGLQNAGAQTVAFAEIDPECQKVLKAKWDGVPIYDDVNSLCGLSLSELESGGKTGGPKGREIKPCLQPDWIVIENTGHRWRSWVPELRRELFELGYSSLPIRVRADWLGFAHRRSRVYLIANANSELIRELSRWWIGPCREAAKKLAESRDKTPRGLGANDGIPSWTHRRRQLGNAVMPIFPELIGLGIQSITSGRSQ